MSLNPITEQHGFEALRLRLKDEFKELEPTAGAQDGGAIDKVLGPNGSLCAMREAINGLIEGHGAQDERIRQLEEAIQARPF